MLDRITRFLSDAKRGQACPPRQQQPNLSQLPVWQCSITNVVSVASHGGVLAPRDLLGARACQLSGSTQICSVKSLVQVHMIPWRQIETRKVAWIGQVLLQLNLPLPGSDLPSLLPPSLPHFTHPSLPYSAYPLPPSHPLYDLTWYGRCPESTASRIGHSLLPVAAKLHNPACCLLQ